MEIQPLKLWKQGDTSISSNYNSNHIQKEDKSNSRSLSKETEINPIAQNLNKNKNSVNPNKKNLVNEKIGKKDNSKNLESTEIRHAVPQKVLHLSKRAISIKKSPLLMKNILYKNAFINNFRPLLMYNYSQNFSKNKRQININKGKKNLSNTQDLIIKPISIFTTYKNYQKKFFSSTFSLNSSINNNQNINTSNKFFSVDMKNKNDKYTSMSNTSLNNTNVNFNKKNKKEEKNKMKLVKKPPRSVSNLLKQKDQDKIPMVLNSPITFIKNFKSNSEKERDEKNSNALLKLRNILDKNWEKRLEYVKEFFVLNQINDDEYYNNIMLENFAHFVHDNIDNDTNMMKGVIETRIPMKQIINKGIKYKNYSMRKMVKSNSMPAIKNPSGENIESQLRNRYKKMSILINNFGRFRAKEKILSINNNNNNNKYQISEEGKESKKQMKSKIIKYRDFINRNYAANIINKFMGKYNEEEKKNYFNKRKVGTIYIPDKGNLANSINKQTEFFKLKSTAYTSKIKSIHSFSEKDVNDLYTELQQVKEDYISENDKEMKNKDNNKEDFWVKTYENLKKKIFERQPENILKEKKKLLEYIVYQYIKERRAFEQDLLK